MALKDFTKQNILDAVEKIERENIILKKSIDFDVIINNKAYPPKEVMRYASLIVKGNTSWTPSGGEPTNNYLKQFNFPIVPKKLAVDEISNLIRNFFESVWRCADSNVWNELRDSDLLSFIWLDPNIDYSKIKIKELERGKKVIYPWVNELKLGDLIFIMGKNTFNGICVVESEYNYKGPFISLQEHGDKPAIKVKYLYKVNSPINHDLITHNQPPTFARIDQYNFGLNNVINFLMKTKPDAIDQIIKYIETVEENYMKSTKLTDLGINTILYGPPGTGKTFKLNEYKQEHFTDKGIIMTSDDLLKEKVSIYPFWKVLGAVLGTSSNSLTVAEIIEHPVIKARINPSNKTKINNRAWAELQTYADDHSTQLDGKYRRSIKLFHKSDNSKWSIAEDKQTDLNNIIEQELLDIAARPVFPSLESITSKQRFNFITFHQKYSYEDFIEGIKPLLKKDDTDEHEGELQFELKKGIFYNSCLEALRLVGYESFEDCYNDTEENRSSKFDVVKNNPLKQFALFIDEINRANISAVFGELITLLEEDKRIGADNEMWIELPYSNDKFCVPANLYVIGTMNTADRSIALLDIALRRRFEFQALYPLYTETEWWSSILEALNTAIYNWRKNPDFFIGHAFFINKPETDKIKILNTKIIPLLYEYCQSNAATVKNILIEAGVDLKSTGIKENFQIIAE